MRSVARCLLAASAAGHCLAADLTATLSVAPEWRTDNRASAYFVAPAQDRSARQDLGLRFQDGGFNAQGTLRILARQGQTPERHGIANQFYYDGEMDGGNAWTAGKKVMSWGVGFGFRPLDVVQREDRRAANAAPLVGVPLLAWERFSADQALTLAWTRPGSGRGAVDGDDTALAARWYRLTPGGTDLHAVARLSRRNALEAGAGFSNTVGEEWAFHGAVLNQRRYMKTLNVLAENGGGVLATASPLQENARRNALKAVAGGQWTGSSGIGVLIEGWYDGAAYSREEWRRLDALTAAQRALTGLAPQAAIDGNVAWSSQAFDRPNLLRENLLARLSYDEEQRWKYAVEWLSTPRDGGRAVTLSLTFQGNRQQLGGGLRFLGGHSDSALAQAPFKRVVWLEWRLALP